MTLSSSTNTTHEHQATEQLIPKEGCCSWEDFGLPAGPPRSYWDGSEVLSPRAAPAWLLPCPAATSQGPLHVCCCDRGRVTQSHECSISAAGGAPGSLAAQPRALQGHSFALHAEQAAGTCWEKPQTCPSLKQRKSSAEEALGEALDPLSCLPEGTAL